MIVFAVDLLLFLETLEWFPVTQTDFKVLLLGYFKGFQCLVFHNIQFSITGCLTGTVYTLIYHAL